MGCPLRVQVGALYGSRAWQGPLQQAPLMVFLLGDWGFCGLGASVEGSMGGGRLREETGGEEVERSCRDDCELDQGVGRMTDDNDVVVGV